MDGWVPILFLAVILKIPIFAGLYLVWYSVRAEPETEDAPGEGEHGFRRWRREPKSPRGPRRSPHAGGDHLLPDCPPGGRLRVERSHLSATASAGKISRR